MSKPVKNDQLHWDIQYSVENSQDNFWMESTHKGFSFDVTDGFESTSSSTVISSSTSDFPGKDKSRPFISSKNKQLEPLTDCSVTRKSFSRDISSSNLHREDDGPTFNPTDNSNPLLIFPKKGISTGGAEKAVRDMILGLDCNLNEFKSKQDKLYLLEVAQSTHDGNAILEVVLYLRSTLKKSIFDREIRAFPDAFNVYLNYLKEDNENEELYQILQYSGKPEVAAFLKYEAAASCSDVGRKVQLIENCLSTHFQLLDDPFHRHGIEQHYKLLKEQIEHYPSYKNDEVRRKTFEAVTGRKDLLNSSVLTSLMYACLFYYKIQDNTSSLTSPQQMQVHYHLKKRQYTWALLRSLAALQRWFDMDDLFFVKNWRGNVKAHCVISFSRAVEVLVKVQAPIEVLSKYLSLIENEKEKLELAQKYGCHSVAIEVFKNNKDRLGLIKYKSVIPPHSPDLVSIIEALNNQSIRWKN